MNKTLLALALVATGAIADPVPCGGFVDVQQGGELCNATEWMKNRGITLGCAPGYYCPNDVVTRGQLALFLRRASTVPEVYSTRDRTEGEADTWQSNALVCVDTIPPKPYARTVVAQASLSLRYSMGIPGDRWPVEWQLQYSFVGQSPWYASNEQAYADTAVNWFFTSVDSGTFSIPPGLTAVTGLRLFYAAQPLWGKCNVTYTVYPSAP